MSLPPEEERFAKNASVLFDVLGECTDTLAGQGKETIDRSTLVLGQTMVASVDPHYLIKMFIKNVHPYWNAIAAKDEKFFIDNATTVFRFLPASQVAVLRSLFLEKTVQTSIAEHKAQVWDLFRAMVRISLKYCQRFPEVVAANNIDLSQHLQTWKIKG